MAKKTSSREENNASLLEDFINQYRAYESGRKGEEDSQDPRSKISKKADDDRNNAAYQLGVRMGMIDKNVPIDKVPDKLMRQAREYLFSHLKSDSDNNLYNNINSIVSEIDGKSLEAIVGTIAGSKELQGLIPKSEAKMMQAYGQVAGFEDLKKRYSEGKLTEEEAENLSRYAVEGAGKSAADREKARQKATPGKYDDKRLQNLAAEVAKMAVALGVAPKEDVKKYINSGIDSEITKAREKYEETAKKEGRTIEDSYRAVVANAVLKGNAKQFDAVSNVIYQVVSEDRK